MVTSSSSASSSPSAPEPSQASWFGEQNPDTVEAWQSPSSAFGSRQESASSFQQTARRIASDRPTFPRIYRAFLGARIALALTLLGLVAGAWGIGSPPPLWMPVLSVGYLAITVAVWDWPALQKRSAVSYGSLNTRQTLSTIGMDLFAFALLHYFAGANLNTQALLVLPVLMASVLMNRTMALGVAAAATLNLLSVAWIQSREGAGITALMTQAGLNGFGLFVIAALASELSARLAREERSARGSLELARQQAQLNRLVIEEMSEGVLVVDRQGRVRTANPAARRLLSAQGLVPTTPFALKGARAWQPLIQAIDMALRHPASAEEGQDVRLSFDDNSQRELRLRMRFNRGNRQRSAAEDLCVMFMEDLRSIHAKQRQDKLAAMGRMSAGLAHEVRNPLAAIAQANALLAEDATSPTQKRLTQMVTDNVARIKYIIDDILAVAPGVRPQAPLIDVLDTVMALCDAWRGTAGLTSGEHSLMDIDIRACREAPTYPHIMVRFEVDHMQRVLVNLLDNALRYNTGDPKAIVVSARWTAHSNSMSTLMVSVFNDGPPINADTERALFEPFFSTRSRGTGLGLYICRELCERHGASIDYRLHPPSVRHRNEFFITMPVEYPSTTHFAE